MLIVHVSDLHIGAGGRSRWRLGGLGVASDAALEKLAAAGTTTAVRAALKCDQTVTAVTICSGDYSVDGANLNQGLMYVEDVARIHARLSAGLRSLPLSRGVLGNHDIWGGASPVLAWLFPGRKLGDSEHLLGRPRVARWDEPPAGPFVVGDLAVHIYFVDSNAAGLRNVFARGRVRGADLERLRCLVADDAAVAPRRPMLRVLVMHHPLAGHCHHVTMKLENAPEVTDFLREHRFGIILSGHEHEPALDRMSHGLWQCVAGSACQTESSRGVNTFFALEIGSRVDTDLRGIESVQIAFHRFERPYDGRDDPAPYRLAESVCEGVAVAWP